MRGASLGAALLFDLDGTLVDTDALHLRAFQEVFARHAVTIDRAQYLERIMGFPNPAIGAWFLPGLSEADQELALADKESVFRDSIGALEPVAGLIELLDHAETHAIPCAVVTNAPRPNVEAMLDALQLSDRLPLRIVGAELARAKPDPLPYLTGLKATGALAERSLAFEDSLSGLAAAVGAGLAVVGVTTSLDAVAMLAAGATIAVADFTDARIFDLVRARTGAGDIAR